MEKYTNLGFPLKSLNDFKMLEQVLQNRQEFEDAVSKIFTYIVFEIIFVKNYGGDTSFYFAENI